MWPWNFDDFEKPYETSSMFLDTVFHFIAIHEIKLKGKRSNWSQIVNYFTLDTLKFEKWPPKKIGHLFYATWSLISFAMNLRKTLIKTW